MRKIAEIFGVTIEALLPVSEEAEDARLKNLLGDDYREALKKAGLAPAPADAFVHKVPIISWASAGIGGNYSDMEGFLDEYVYSQCADPHAYGLIVEGDSMEPKFSAGDRIIVAPNLQAQNGELVVARHSDSGQVYFKLFHLMGSENKFVRLTSYNPLYPPLEFKLGEFRFIQPVYESHRKLRRG
jgi:phage repressor protein C with HTH and peptisase S24 domain